MEKIVKDTDQERDIIRTINENEQRLTDLMYMLGSTEYKREHYVKCKNKCENLKSVLRIVAGTGIVAIGALAISVGIVNGNGALGNAIFYAGLLSLCSLPIIYKVKTKHERRFIANHDYKVLSMNEYKLRNAVQRREERKTSLRTELNHIRGISDAPIVVNDTDKVVGVNKELAKQK